TCGTKRRANPTRCKLASDSLPRRNRRQYADFFRREGDALGRDPGAETPRASCTIIPKSSGAFLLEGSAVRVQDGEEIPVKKGDFWHAPGNVPHTMRAGPEGARVLDVFSPPRPEYRKAGSTRWLGRYIPADWSRGSGTACPCHPDKDTAPERPSDCAAQGSH